MGVMARKPSPRVTTGAFPPFSVWIGQAFRRYFITGLATLFPVSATLVLLVWLFKFVDGRLRALLGLQIPGLGLLVTVLIILTVGVITVHFFGRVLFTTLEVWFARLPLIRTVYPSIKQLAQFIFNEESRHTAFRRVVLVEYPRPGAYSIAFVTNEAKTTVTGSRQTLLTLLIPNPPSPFTGPIIFVPDRDVVPLTLSVEGAIKLIVSGGVVASPLEAAQ